MLRALVGELHEPVEAQAQEAFGWMGCKQGFEKDASPQR